jgi:hypothetical protein
MSGQAKQKKHTIPRVAFRFVAGRDLDRQAHEQRTNATWWHPADADRTDRPARARGGGWRHKRHAERAAWRMGSLSITLAALYGLLAARRITYAALAVAGLAGLAAGIWRLTLAIRLWTHTRHIVAPLYQTLAPIAGHPPNDHHGRYLTIPRDFVENEKAKVKLMLSPVWEGGVTQQKAITGLMSRRLNTDLEAHWYPHVFPPYAEFIHAPTPPGKVSYAEFKPYMDKSPAHIIPVGLGTGKTLQSINLDDETPHVALSIGTGGGKTALMMLIIAFLHSKGVERIDVINTKRTGYSWCAKLPNVFVHNTMKSQMDAIHETRMCMESRYDALETDDTLTFPRRVLIIEEQNSWITYAKQYWDDMRNDMDNKQRSKTPKKNPAIADIGFILFQGRQACVNVISLFQRMSAGAAGGGDMRDQYGAKLIGRSSPQSWKILTGTTPMPKEAKSTIRGRCVLHLGDESHALQLAYLTQDEAVQYAMSGRPVTNTTGPGTPLTAVPTEKYSIREIADSKVIPISYAALRRARSRDRNFPVEAEKLYTIAQIKAWHENRVSSRRAA